MTTTDNNEPQHAAPSLGEWAGVAGAAAVAVAALASTAHLTVLGSFGPGPGLFPRIIGIALLLIATVHAAYLLRSTLAARSARAGSAGEGERKGPTLVAAEAPPRPGRGAAARFVAMSASMFIYALVLETLGFILTTIALAFTALCLLGRHPLRAFVEAVVAVLCLWVLFGHFLDVPLPPSDLPFLRAMGL